MQADLTRPYVQAPLPDAPPLEDLPDAGPPAPPSEEYEEDAPSLEEPLAGIPGIPKVARDRLAAEGRRRAEAERKAADAEHLALQALKRSRELEEQMAARAAAERIRYPQQESRVQYQERRSRELLQMANDHYGLTGERALSAESQGIDWANEQTFIASVDAIARVRAAERSGSSAGEDDMAKRGNGKTDEDKLRAEIRAEERQKLQRESGAGRPLSARPSGAGRGQVTTEDIQDVLVGYDSRKGPKETRAQLQELAKRARAQVRQ
jgi:hypothetical protein